MDSGIQDRQGPFRGIPPGQGIFIQGIQQQNGVGLVGKPIDHIERIFPYLQELAVVSPRPKG